MSSHTEIAAKKALIELQTGIAARERGEFTKAIQNLEIAARIFNKLVDSGHYRYTADLGDTYYEFAYTRKSNDDLDGMIQDFERVLTITPGHGKTVRALSEAYMEKIATLDESDDPAGATVLHERIIPLVRADEKLREKISEKYQDRGLQYRLKGEPHKGLANYQRALDFGPFLTATALSNYAGSLTQAACEEPDPHVIAELKDRAQGAWEEALHIDPEHIDARLALIELNITCFKYEQAAKGANMLWSNVKNRERTVCAWLGALALTLSGRPDSEAAEYESYLQDSPTKVNKRSWVATEIDHHIDEVKQSNLPASLLKRIKHLHGLFMGNLS